MGKIVFYSWQSDNENTNNRNFIKNCIEKALKQLNNIEIEEPIRLDQDTQDVPGLPDIANTIFGKIEQSDIFLADVSFIGKSNGGKNIPNPNVLIELGYALSSIGASNLILVMNEFYGSPNDGLPFDLAHKRWPITYNLPPDIESEEKIKIKENLIKSIQNAMHMIILHQTNYSKYLNDLSTNPTQENIENIIKESDEINDWDRRINNQLQTAIFKKNVNLRIEINYNIDGVHTTQFNEKWATNHPDKKATSYYCKTYFGLTIIRDDILVSVDGGRAFVPIPHYQSKTVDLLTYKIAKIIDQPNRTDEYMRRSGLTLKSV